MKIQFRTVIIELPDPVPKWLILVIIVLLIAYFLCMALILASFLHIAAGGLIR